MKHIFKKLHKSQNDANRSNETLTPASGASTNQSQQPGSSDHADSAAVASQAPATPMAAPATEAVVVPASHASGGGAWGTNRGGDFFSSEEDFQMQLALAISASNSEVQDDPENDQIRAATLLSLGRSNSMDRRGDVEVSGEALSRRYWDYNVLDYKEKVIDGFYDVYAIDMDPTSPGKIPSLVDLETSPGDSGYEAIIVNRTIDAMLLELEQVAHCIAIDCPPSNVNVFVQRLAELVTDHMGGPVKDANTMLARWMERSAELRTSLHTSVFPIGSLKLGMTRHRALLFKVIADNVGLSCKLMKGCHYTGVEDVAVNMIKLDDEREYLVDLMADPGTLIPADVLSAKDCSSQSTNQVLKKLPYMQLTNDSEAAYPRPKQTKCINPATSMGTAEKPMQLDRMMGIEMAKAPPSSATKLTSSNQIDFPSTSAVGASLHKANRGALTAGDGLRMNVNVVPYNQNNVDEAKNLFADLNPFQIRGSGRLVQNKSQEDKFVESQRQRTDPVSGRPPLPMMWKHNQAMNQVPKKKNQDFVHSLLPRNNHDASDCNKSSSASSCSPSEIIYPNTSKGTIETYVPCHYKNAGNSENISSIAAPDRMGSNSLSLTDSRKIIHDGRSQGSEGTLSPEISDIEKGHKIGVNGVQDHCSTHDSFMKTNMLPHDKGSCNCAIDPSASSANPVLDDVGECEIPWEDLDIGKRIGIGSYGEVYHADWNGTEVAVKKFLDQDFSGAALAEFKREVRIMRKLWHPNIVLFMGAVTRPPHLSIISEYLPRGSLYRIIHRPNCQIDERRRLKMALDVARGMNCLHTSVPTIVHRDLKSPNLLVDKNWTVKVCDFGLSRLKHNTFLSSKSAAGTPEWMAPEVLRNEPLNEKCDVYSFGVILWELATLKLPWSKMNPMQVVGAVGFRNQRLEIPKEVDPLVARIIQECWQTDPSLRPSFAELCVALKPLQHLNIHSSSADQQSSPMPQQISVNSKPMF